MVFALAVLLGCDLFDSASYVKYARAGRMMFVDGTRHASELEFANCECPVCTQHSPQDLKRDERASAKTICSARSGGSGGAVKRLRPETRGGPRRAAAAPTPRSWAESRGHGDPPSGSSGSNR